jgi:hypothetical protein
MGLSFQTKILSVKISTMFGGKIPNVILITIGCVLRGEYSSPCPKISGTKYNNGGYIW